MQDCADRMWITNSVDYIAVPVEGGFVRAEDGSDTDLLGLLPNQKDLLNLVDGRHLQHSTIATSQMAVGHWQETMAIPTLG